MSVDFKPGRLRNVLDKFTTSDPAFAVYSEPTEGIYDEDIHSVVVHRGKSGRGGGHTASTMELTVNGVLSPTSTGQNVRYFMRDLMAADLAAYTNQTQAAIQYRYEGRLGKIDVEDTASSKVSTIYAASWLSRVYMSTHAAYPKAGDTIDKIFSDALSLPDNPRGIFVDFGGTFDPVAADQDAATFSDAATKYGSDIGICFFELRSGRTLICTLPYRRSRVTGLATTWLPLTRSQAISPATWRQANEHTANRVMYSLINANGNKVTRTAEIDTGDPLKETVTKDWTYIKSSVNGTSGQLYQEAYGEVYKTNTRQFSIPSIKVDLLYLLDSPKDYHHHQAGQLLAMEVGDPIFLSGDWPAELRGTHLAEGIREVINGNEWYLEFDLVRYADALGFPDTVNITPRVWESAVNNWDQETLQWDKS